MINNTGKDTESSVIKRRTLQGIGLAILGTFFFSLKSIFIKLSYTEGANAEQVMLLRALFSAPVFAWILWRVRGKKKRQKGHATLSYAHFFKIVLLGFIGYFLASYLDLLGLELISTQLERLTLFTYPTMIAILAAIFLKEKLTLGIIFSLVFCYLGIWFIYGQEVQIESHEHVNKGVALVVGSALCYSVYVIMAKPLIQRYGSVEFTSINMLASALFMLLYFIFFVEHSIFQLNWKIYSYGALLALFCTVIPSYCITTAISYIGATRTTITGTIGPIFTIALGVFLLDEAFGLLHLTGMALVVFGVCIITISKKNTHKAS